MKKQIILHLWDALERLHKEEKASSCLEVLDDKGQRWLFLSCGDVLPVSLSVSGRKAATSHAFHMSSDEAASALSSFGTVSLLEEPYCFLPGGAMIQPEKTPPFFLGLSTDRPDKDKPFVEQLAAELTRFINSL